MTLTFGTKLGPYEIVANLGAGGMGEVYRAHDTRLGRDVAVKVLPSHLSANPDVKERFEREARALSAVSHPHICHLYDVGHHDGTDYLVMELLEGESLAERLQKGPLALQKSLEYGVQIAEALETAHKLRIVHRDLKPGNIMLTKSGAKLLDFGLAKPAHGMAGIASASVATMSKPLTAEGTIVGTCQYMAPEQVEGKGADARTDIFAFGAVLYEMISGQRAFQGKSQISVMSAILEKEPEPLQVLKPLTPHSLEHVVKRALAKDPEERWQSAADLKAELKWIAEGGSQAGEVRRISARRWRWERASWLLAAAFILVAMAAGTTWWKTSGSRPLAMYFHASVPFAANDVALSADGRTLAMVAYSAQANNYILWIYEIGSRQSRPINGTQGATYPFWSPDRKFIGFFADGKLKKVDEAGGQVQVLCDAPNGRGATWNQDGVIVFTPEASGGLSRVSSAGGPPVVLTTTDPARLESTHRWPVFLPDGKHFIYLAANFTGRLENNMIFVGSLDSRETQSLVNTSANAAFAEPGYLVYLRDRILVAQAFDKRRYVLSGEPYTLSDEVLYFPGVDRAVFSVSSGKVLVTQTGKGASVSQMTWFDRSGKATEVVGRPGSYNNVRLSPDGRRIATDQPDADGRKNDVWIHEPVRGGKKLTFDPGVDQAPIWSADGKQILFSSNREFHFHLYLKNADGSGSEETVADFGTRTMVNPWDWSRDGKYILVRKANELWYLPLENRIAKPLLQPKWTIRNAQFSPDSRWMAYASNETGSMEIYVSPFPSGSGKWQVSTGGGEEPRWRQDGKELFYLSADGKMMAAAVNISGSFEAGPPVALFQTRRRQAISSQDVFSYDVSGDGKRFLISTRVDEANAAPLSVLLNWNSQMEK